MPFCKTCGEWTMYASSHVCPPVYYVWADEWHGFDDEGDKVLARDHEAAAEKWAERYDSDGEYTIVGGSDANLRVRAFDESEWKYIVVSGESVPQYTAGEARQRLCEHAFNGSDTCYRCGFESKGVGDFKCPGCGNGLRVAYRKRYVDHLPVPFAHEEMRYSCHKTGCYKHGEVRTLMGEKTEAAQNA